MLVQRVVMPDEVGESWTVLDDAFAVVEPVERFLAYLAVVERSPGTVRSYAFDLRDFFWFVTRHELSWTEVTLEDFGRFVGWLRLPPAARSWAVTVLPGLEPHCSASTISRKLSAVASFYEFHVRHGVGCGELLTRLPPGGARGSWRPFLAHLGDAGQRSRAIKVTPSRRLPKTVTGGQIESVLPAVSGCGTGS